jgi:hypothetical protein
MSQSSLLEMLRNWWATVSAYILLTIAGTGILYDAFHRFGDHKILGELATPEQVLILLVALLCGGLGAERLLTLRKIERDIAHAHVQRTKLMADVQKTSEHVDSLISRVGTIRANIVADLKAVGKTEQAIMSAVKLINKTDVILGIQNIETAATQLIDDCSDNAKIKATGQYRAYDGLSRSYFEHLANRVVRAKRNHGTMEYFAVVASTPQGMKHHDQRVEIFSATNIVDRLHMRTINHTWPFEVLIGGHCMIIALRGGEMTDNYEVAVKVSDADFVETALNWYATEVWETADKP